VRQPGASAGRRLVALLLLLVALEDGARVGVVLVNLEGRLFGLRNRCLYSLDFWPFLEILTVSWSIELALDRLPLHREGAMLLLLLNTRYFFLVHVVRDLGDLTDRCQIRERNNRVP
jgi:hypothetical protein